MIQKLSVANTRLNAIAALLDGGTVEFWSGAVVTDTTDTPAGTQLGEVDLENPAFSTATTGKLYPVTTSYFLADVAGTISFTRWVSSGGDVIFVATVGEQADISTDLVVSQVAVTTSDYLYVSNALYFE